MEISLMIRLISLGSGQRKIRRKFRRIYAVTCCLVVAFGDEGLQDFPLFFPLCRYYHTNHIVLNAKIWNRTWK